MFIHILLFIIFTSNFDESIDIETENDDFQNDFGHIILKKILINNKL